MTRLYPNFWDLNYRPAKFYYNYTPIDCKKQFFKGNPEITNNKYLSVVYVFFTYLIPFMLKTGLSFYFPNGMGRLYVRMFERKKPYLNLGDTIRLGKPIYVLNLKWGGKYPQLKWEKTEGHYKNIKYISLKLDRMYKRVFQKYKRES